MAVRTSRLAFFLVLASIFALTFINYDKPDYTPSVGRITIKDGKKDKLKLSQGALEWKYCEKTFDRVFGKWLNVYRQCIIDQLKGKSYWNDMRSAVERCRGDSVWRMLDVKLLQNSDDTKLVILAPNDPNGTDCTEVTLGVGTDIQSELQLRKLVPSCKFYGADPILASGKVFRDIGTYFEIAVSAEEGFVNASVLENGGYYQKQVSSVTLVDFLKNYVNTSKVDYLFMDNEGPEYTLYEQFTRNGILEQENITICQISVEFHGPWEQYSMNKTSVEMVLHEMMVNTSFVPFWCQPFWTHLRAYYVNVENEYCLKKFFLPRFCPNQEDQSTFP